MIAVLAVSCLLFWRQANLEHAKMVNLCQGSAQRASENFKEYLATGDGSCYAYGVAEFRSFMNARLYLNNNASDPEYLSCNRIYAEMALNSERVQENMQEVIEALTMLAEDYQDPNGYICLDELGNLLYR